MSRKTTDQSKRDEVKKLKDTIRELKKRDRSKTKEISQLRKLVSKLDPSNLFEEDDLEVVLSDVETLPKNEPQCSVCGSKDIRVLTVGIFTLHTCRMCKHSVREMRDDD